MPSQRNITPKVKNAQLSTRSVGTPACRVSFWCGNSCLGPADAIAFEFDNGFGGAASLRRADLSVEFQNPVTKSRAMYWTVKDPSNWPWGLLETTSQTHMDVIQTGLLAQHPAVKKLLETPT